MLTKTTGQTKILVPAWPHFYTPHQAMRSGGVNIEQMFTGNKHKEESKRKMSLAHMGKKMPESTRQAMIKSGIWDKGRKRSPETVIKMSIGRKGKYLGSDNWAWKGGRVIDGEGYMKVLKRGHPMANKQGYVFEHRLVMSQKLGRNLVQDEQVHHVNGIKLDNRPENLELVKRDKHYGKISCPYCHNHFLIK